MPDTYALTPPLLQRLPHLINRVYTACKMLFANVHEIYKSDDKSEMSKAEINEVAERLIVQYGNSILRLAYSYLKNMSDAEDILQETLIQYMRNSPRFESDSHEKAWFLRVAINRSKNKLKHNKLHNTDELKEALVAEEKEDLAFIWEAVKELPLQYREVIHLFYQEGYSTAQISEILRKKESTVRSLLHRGRKQLKVILKEVYDFVE